MVICNIWHIVLGFSSALICEDCTIMEKKMKKIYFLKAKWLLEL